MAVIHRARAIPLWILSAWLAVALAAWPVIHHPKPDSVDALIAAGISNARQGKWDDAIAVTQKALVRRPESQPAWASLRSLLAARSAAHPTSEALQEQALGLYQAGNFQGCVDTARQALKISPQYPRALNLLSVCFLNLGMLDDAIQTARQAVAIEPTFELARNNLAQAMAMKAKGQTTLNPAASVASNYLNSSLRNYRAGQMQKCVDDARMALRLQPGLAIAWNNIAACSNELGRPDDAIAAAGEALRLQPDLELARNNLKVAADLKAKQAAHRK